MKNESVRESVNGIGTGKRTGNAEAAQMAVMAVVTAGETPPLWIPLREAPGGVGLKEAGDDGWTGGV